ncbi:MAG TPA: hypothetical protein VK871_11965, partial [Candidatus Limnocylindrales bacterium]|nr:hypothetical protein [Candidatus Limnocylindrales bacterium]
MNARPELERIVTDWLQAEATTAGPDRLLTATLARVAVTGQERHVTQRLFGERLGRSPQLRWALLLAATIVALLAVAAIVGGLQAKPAPVGTGGFTMGPSLSVARGMHTATFLNDGRVLV